MMNNKQQFLIEKMYVKHYDGLVNYLMKFFDNDRQLSKDVASRAFLLAIENINKYKPDIARFSTWLYTIAKNEALQELYKKKKRIISIDAEKSNLILLEKQNGNNTKSKMPEYVDYYGREYIEMNIIDKKVKIILKHIDKLKEKYKNIIIMKCFENMSYRQISKKINMNVSTVKSRYRIAKMLLLESAKNDLKKLEYTDFFDIVDEYHGQI